MRRLGYSSATFLVAAALCGFATSPAEAQTPAPAPQIEYGSDNVDLVSRLRLVPRRAFDPSEFSLANIRVHKGFAYVAAFGSHVTRDEVQRCDEGGIFVVDVRRPARPKRAGFIPVPAGNYVEETIEVRTVNTRRFSGDMLVAGIQQCEDPAAAPPRRTGGINLYDVSNPRRPRTLATNFGDDRGRKRSEPAHSYHGTAVWQHNGRAYVAGIDITENWEIDLFDITNPRRARFMREIRLEDGPFTPALGDIRATHEVHVKRIDGRPMMLASSLDTGWGLYDLSRPMRPRVVSRARFPAVDPNPPGFPRPAGNAHSGRFSHDNRWVLGTTEDPFLYRARVHVGDRVWEAMRPLGGQVDFSTIAGGQVQGPPTFVGTGCTGETIPAPPTDDGDAMTYRIAAFTYGDACGAFESVSNIQQAGWDAYVAMKEPTRDQGLLTSGFELEFVSTRLPGIFMRSSEALESMFAGNATLSVGTTGAPTTIRQEFDGSGVVYLYRNRGALMRMVDAYVVPELRDPRLGRDPGVRQFGLEAHEPQADPDRNLLYVGWMQAGLRVLGFGGSGLREVGHYVKKGMYIFDVAILNRGGCRYLVTSDTRFGIELFRYTGPGAKRCS